MSTVTTPFAGPTTYAPSDKPLVRAIDRWIWVFMAASFIVYTLVGFVPDSLMKMDAVTAGQRPPFPATLHAHALLMGSYLLLLFAQTVLMATGRSALHQKLGVASLAIAPALVIVGFLLIPTMYHSNWAVIQDLPAEAQAGAMQGLRIADNIMLLQLRIGILFPAFLAIALLARRTEPGVHKRMMFLSIAMALPAAFDRITWIPSTMPASPVSPDLYVLFAIAPMFIWDLVRTRKLHKAYVIWAAIVAPFTLAVHLLWNTEWWHTTARQLVGLG
jgi:hypothetical protein